MTDRRQPFLQSNIKLLCTIGEGEFGKVKLAVKTDKTQETYAVKVYEKQRISSLTCKKRLQKEIYALQTLNDHENIVTLFDVVHTKEYVGLVLEYAVGGELFEYILAKHHLDEDESRKLFKQLISAVDYMHQKQIVHRDIKLENLLLSRTKNLILIDFGFSNTFTADEISDPPDLTHLMSTSCGSPCYAAPELVLHPSNGYTGTLADVWSCGVVLFAMLSGYLPFDDDPLNTTNNILQLYKYITQQPCPLHFPTYFPANAKELCALMLEADVGCRITVQQLQQHEWVMVVPRHQVKKQRPLSMMEKPNFLKRIIGKLRSKLNRQPKLDAIEVLTMFVPNITPTDLMAKFKTKLLDLGAQIQTSPFSVKINNTEFRIEAQSKNKGCSVVFTKLSGSATCFRSTCGVIIN